MDKQSQSFFSFINWLTFSHRVMWIPS